MKEFKKHPVFGTWDGPRLTRFRKNALKMCRRRFEYKKRGKIIQDLYKSKALVLYKDVKNQNQLKAQDQKLVRYDEKEFKDLIQRSRQSQARDINDNFVDKLIDDSKQIPIQAESQEFDDNLTDLSDIGDIIFEDDEALEERILFNVR